MPPLVHGGIEAVLDVLSEQFEHEAAFLVAGHRAAAGLKLVHELISQRAITCAGFGKVGLDLFERRKRRLERGKCVENGL